MKSGALWKLLTVIFAVAISLYLFLPTVLSPTPEKYGWFYKIFPEKKIKLGLDLRGGMHLVLGVDVDKAIENEVARYQDVFGDYFKEKKINFESVKKEGINKIVVKLKSAEDTELARSNLKKDFQIFIEDEKESASYSGHDTLVYYLNPKWESQIKTQAVSQVIETIRNRIDEFGVTEPTVTKQGDNRVLIQLPGVQDPERALRVIRKTALLEFKIVDKTIPQQQLQAMIDGAVREGKLKENYTAANLNELYKAQIPPETQIYFEVRKDYTTNEERRTPLLLKSKTLLTGEVIEDARVRQNQQDLNSPYYVSLKLNAIGAERMEDITGSNVNEQMAIILDGAVMSAPVIREKIPKQSSMQERLSIELGGMRNADEVYQEATDLVIVLKAGALPAPVIVEENRIVGPSLGKDSVEKGTMALIIGTILVVVFMIFYYGLSGLVADVAVIVNILIILAILAAFQATLTFPGIAGIILTVGMAVDGNVIIIERIREELRAGKTYKAAHEISFTRTHWTIFDANVTTLFAGIVLFQYGTGPVKGFAVTLMIGIFCTYFTSYWVTKFVTDFLMKQFYNVGVGIKLNAPQPQNIAEVK